MKTVHVLHSNLKIVGNELAFLFPLRFNRKRLQRDYNVNLKFFTDINSALYDCDTLITSSWVAGREKKWWANGQRKLLFQFLEEAKERSGALIWADISDSTGTTHFEVLPYVDRYLKGQLLKKRSDYRKKHYASRIFCDYYHQLYDIEDTDPGPPHLNHFPEEKELKKLYVGWNTGMANYGQREVYWGIASHFYPYLRLPVFYHHRWHSPSAQRSIPLSCRIGAKYSRKTAAAPRLRIMEILKGMIPTNKIPRKEYFAEMQQSRLCISPFGLGEISLRDFEVMIAGAAILKQNSDHMETWPNFFVDKITYIGFSWDLSDFYEKTCWAHENPNEVLRIAESSQSLYRKLTCTKEGHHNFCKRFIHLCVNL
ncbi:MAG: hypothetical protein COB67_04245 [SAR324 cluster bacterium]|uniref:Glycosyltransferase family 1 protein n=1 Tax=SAR324 cluster bacterium TaxID=2024889 RepID=A0A2A4T6V0_9DELT|nr:MAG: hypothetical protein COB67_04245 [SAR324 cluster bacterium]